MQQIDKEYDRRFVLEPTKLTRLIDKIHERLDDHKHTKQVDRFEVYLTDNHREEITNLEQVLALENSRKHKITRLVAICCASTAQADRPEHEVRVDFAHPKGTGGNIRKIVVVHVRSEADGWAGRTLSEVEEQIERTWQRHLPPTLLLLTLLVLIGFVALSPIIRFESSGRPANQWMWLGSSDVDRIEAMMKQPHTLTDEEVREVRTMQLRNLVEASRPQPNNTRQLLYLTIPSVLVAGCIIVLLTMCYPKAVFLWGDEIDRYANVSQMRKLLWGLIVSVVFVGIASKMLYEGIFASWIVRK